MSIQIFDVNSVDLLAHCVGGDHFVAPELSLLDLLVLEVVHSSIKRTELDILGCVGVKFTQVKEFLAIEAHHDEVFALEVLIVDPIESSAVSVVLDVRPEVHRGVQVIEDLVVPIDSVSWEDHERRQRVGWVSLLLVVQAEHAFHDEAELCHFDTIFKYHHAPLLSFESPCEHPDDCFVNEALLARVEEVPKVSSELFEEKIDQLGLVLGRKNLVEVEVFNEHVEIVGEGIVDEA